MTITEFLLARIAEDEAEAREAIEWRTKIQWRPGAEPTGPDMDLICWEDSPTPAVLVGAERVLAECEAKRQIVEREESNLRDQWQRRSAEHQQTWERWLSRKGRGEMLTLRDLASVYADHPDYDESWRTTDG